MARLTVDEQFPILIGNVRGEEHQCDLRPLMRLVPRLKPEAKKPCIEQLVKLVLKPLDAIVFVLIAREFTNDRKIEGHIVEIQGGPNTEIAESLEAEKIFDGNHVFYVRARIISENRQKKYRRLEGENAGRKTTEEEREIRDMKEFTLETPRDLDLNNLFDDDRRPERGGGGRGAGRGGPPRGGNGRGGDRGGSRGGGSYRDRDGGGERRSFGDRPSGDRASGGRPGGGRPGGGRSRMDGPTVVQKKRSRKKKNSSS